VVAEDNEAMLKSIHIEHFRGFQDLKVEPLRSVNLIAGQNDSGKTALLEAIYVLLMHQHVQQHLPGLFRVPAQNASPEQNFWPWLFYNKDFNKDVVIRAATSESPEIGVMARHRSRRIQGQVEGFKPSQSWGEFQWFMAVGQNELRDKVAVFSTHPSNPVQDAIDYNRVVLKRQKTRVQEMLKAIEPRLEAIEPLQTGHQAPLIYVDVGLSEMIPVTQMGQGFNRLLDIYSELLASDAKVLLIDEIENGIHHSVLPTIWKGLLLAAREVGIQVFATTHSLECILAADHAARDATNYDLNLIRLDRVNGNIKATVMDEKTLATAKEFGWELR
jgi:AAA15 family ATPase/GTPase